MKASLQVLEISSECHKYANLLHGGRYKTLECVTKVFSSNISGHADPHQESMHTCGVIYENEMLGNHSVVRTVRTSMLQCTHFARLTNTPLLVTATY